MQNQEDNQKESDESIFQIKDELNKKLQKGINEINEKFDRFLKKLGEEDTNKK